MINLKNYKIFFLILSIAGVLFSGYMSFIKFFSHTCAFGETCPFFLGLPACYFGFAIFLSLLIFSLILFLGKWDLQFVINSLFISSLLGVLFAGRFAIEELPELFQNGFKAYLLGLPTCVMGWMFFIIIFVTAFFLKRKLRTL